MANMFHDINQKIASSRAGAWFFSKTQRQLDVFVLKLTGKYTATSILAGLPLVILEVRGAKSGKIRSVPLLCIGANADGSNFAVLASNWGQAPYPAWYHNLKAHPQVQGTINGTRRDYHAEEVAGEAYDHYWRQAQNMYPGFNKYRSRIGDKRPIPIISFRAT